MRSTVTLTNSLASLVDSSSIPAYLSFDEAYDRTTDTLRVDNKFGVTGHVDLFVTATNTTTNAPSRRVIHVDLNSDLCEQYTLTDAQASSLLFGSSFDLLNALYDADFAWSYVGLTTDVQYTLAHHWSLTNLYADHLGAFCSLATSPMSCQTQSSIPYAQLADLLAFDASSLSAALRSAVNYTFRLDFFVAADATPGIGYVPLQLIVSGTRNNRTDSQRVVSEAFENRVVWTRHMLAASLLSSDVLPPDTSICGTVSDTFTASLIGAKPSINSSTDVPDALAAFGLSSLPEWPSSFSLTARGTLYRNATLVSTATTTDVSFHTDTARNVAQVSLAWLVDSDSGNELVDWRLDSVSATASSSGVVTTVAPSLPPAPSNPANLTLAFTTSNRTQYLLVHPFNLMYGARGEDSSTLNCQSTQITSTASNPLVYVRSALLYSIFARSASTSLYSTLQSSLTFAGVSTYRGTLVVTFTTPLFDVRTADNSAVIARVSFRFSFARQFMDYSFRAIPIRIVMQGTSFDGYAFPYPPQRDTTAAASTVLLVESSVLSSSSGIPFADEWNIYSFSMVAPASRLFVPQSMRCTSLLFSADMPFPSLTSSYMATVTIANSSLATVATYTEYFDSTRPMLRVDGRYQGANVCELQYPRNRSSLLYNSSLLDHGSSGYSARADWATRPMNASVLLSSPCSYVQWDAADLMLNTVRPSYPAFMTLYPPENWTFSRVDYLNDQPVSVWTYSSASSANADGVTFVRSAWYYFSRLYAPAATTASSSDIDNANLSLPVRFVFQESRVSIAEGITVLESVQVDYAHFYSLRVMPLSVFGGYFELATLYATVDEASESSLSTSDYVGESVTTSAVTAAAVTLPCAIVAGSDAYSTVLSTTAVDARLNAVSEYDSVPAIPTSFSVLMLVLLRDDTSLQYSIRWHVDRWINRERLDYALSVSSLPTFATDRQSRIYVYSGARRGVYDLGGASTGISPSTSAQVSCALLGAPDADAISTSSTRTLTPTSSNLKHPLLTHVTGTLPSFFASPSSFESPESRSTRDLASSNGMQLVCFTKAYTTTVAELVYVYNREACWSYNGWRVAGRTSPVPFLHSIQDAGYYENTTDQSLTVFTTSYTFLEWDMTRPPRSLLNLTQNRCAPDDPLPAGTDDTGDGDVDSEDGFGGADTSTASPNSGGSTAAVALPSSSSDDEDLSVGQIVGIAVGLTVFVFLLAFMLRVMWRRMEVGKADASGGGGAGGAGVGVSGFSSPVSSGPSSRSRCGCAKSRSNAGDMCGHSRPRTASASVLGLRRSRGSADAAVVSVELAMASPVAATARGADVRAAGVEGDAAVAAAAAVHVQPVRAFRLSNAPAGGEAGADDDAAAAAARRGGAAANGEFAAVEGGGAVEPVQPVLRERIPQALPPVADAGGVHDPNVADAAEPAPAAPAADLAAPPPIRLHDLLVRMMAPPPPPQADAPGGGAAGPAIELPAPPGAGAAGAGAGAVGAAPRARPVYRAEYTATTIVDPVSSTYDLDASVLDRSDPHRRRFFPAPPRPAAAYAQAAQAHAGVHPRPAAAAAAGAAAAGAAAAGAAAAGAAAAGAAAAGAVPPTLSAWRAPS